MSYKVLLAEDEISLRSIVSGYLSKKGFQVDAVSNGDEAEYAVNKKVYDIIILDIMMPGQDGLQVCKKYVRNMTFP